MKPWVQWEDYHAGMYRSDLRPDVSAQAAALLSDPEAFYETAREMTRVWSHATYYNLAVLDLSRNAWVGHASCCYSVGATRGETCAAWGTLTDDDQDVANGVARRVRAEWERSLAETLFVD